MGADAIPMALCALVAVCALLASYGFRGRVTHVGIDLGTTYSVVAIREHDDDAAASGSGPRVRVISDPRTGSALLPSVVSYQPGGVRAVGRAAKARVDTDPRNTLFHAKRFMGRRVEEVEVQQAADEHSFRVGKNPVGLGPVGSGADRSITSEVLFQLEASGHPASVAPEDVGSAVIQELLRTPADLAPRRTPPKPTPIRTRSLAPSGVRARDPLHGG